jgi:hypothetical protein
MYKAALFCQVSSHLLFGEAISDDTLNSLYFSVMVIKNLDQEKGIVNGSRGVVLEFVPRSLKRMLIPKILVGHSYKARDE